MFPTLSLPFPQASPKNSARNLTTGFERSAETFGTLASDPDKGAEVGRAFKKVMHRRKLCEAR